MSDIGKRPDLKQHRGRSIGKDMRSIGKGHERPREAL